ncbi:hypothetical protein AAL_08261 [Moelleriella libera RCEF 2490]|uniref:Uncharacterized protein n=1 Tax=Moelleriella libera RCEF 2490 TaxID=1081109 RepID=A0A166N671_9HYPO|nr:hypothetical protein AAL_08261 [Moelleriella libera RCEF 2490]
MQSKILLLSTLVSLAAALVPAVDTRSSNAPAVESRDASALDWATTAAAAAAIEKRDVDDDSLAAKKRSDDVAVAQHEEYALEAALLVVNSVPDEVLALGDVATRDYLNKSHLLALESSTELSLAAAEFEALGFFDCAISLGKLLAKGGKLGSSIAKLRDLIKQAGGIIKVLKAIFKGGKGGIIGEIRALMSQFKEVKKACKL